MTTSFAKYSAIVAIVAASANPVPAQSQELPSHIGIDRLRTNDSITIKIRPDTLRQIAPVKFRSNMPVLSFRDFKSYMPVAVIKDEAAGRGVKKIK